MKRNELKARKTALETYATMIKMMDYEEALFNGTICALIDSYAEYHNMDKLELTTKIYSNLRTNDHE